MTSLRSDCPDWLLTRTFEHANHGKTCAMLRFSWAFLNNHSAIMGIGHKASQYFLPDMVRSHSQVEYCKHFVVPSEWTLMRLVSLLVCKSQPTDHCIGTSQRKFYWLRLSCHKDLGCTYSKINSICKMWSADFEHSHARSSSGKTLTQVHGVKKK